MDLKITRVRNVKLPTRGTSKSAGLDFYIPKYNIKECDEIMSMPTTVDSFIFHDEKNILILPHGRINLPSGIHVNLPEKYMMVMDNKSGKASKLGLCVLAKIIDEDYMGEIHLNVVNTSKEEISLYFGEKILQGILIPVLYANVNEVKNLDDLYKEKKSERKDGGFGSTGDF